MNYIKEVSQHFDHAGVRTYCKLIDKWQEYNVNCGTSKLGLMRLIESISDLSNKRQFTAYQKVVNDLTR